MQIKLYIKYALKKNTISPFCLVYKLIHVIVVYKLLIVMVVYKLIPVIRTLK